MHMRLIWTESGGVWDEASGLSAIGLVISLQSFLTGQTIASVRNHNPERGAFLTEGRASSHSWKTMLRQIGHALT